METSNSQRPLYLAFLGLMVLLAATIGCSFVFSGLLGAMVAMAIATSKMLLVMFIFMDLRRSPSSVRFAACAGFLWLFFAVFCTLADFTTRGWNEVPEKTATRELPTTYDRVEFEN
ncbi:MAG: caa(3)-type oxidase subunit IV [Planctomycetaceae bacterium]|nr:caa(3)-type oxidase subunit IV [Planctomycetaceae bacterium]